MSNYIVKPNQNIFDIAIHLYGSIEGVFDLLISNEQLSMSSDLHAGQTLQYHEGFVINESIVREMSDQFLVPANNERHVYFKNTDQQLAFVCMIDPDRYVVELSVSGDGVMLVDWGDNTGFEEVHLTHNVQKLEHYFDSESEKRKIQIYGNFSFITLDTTKLHGQLFPVRPIVVDEYSSHSNGFSLDGLLLFEGTYKVDLQKCTISSLLPVGDMSLQVLDLRNANFTNLSVIDTYLEYVVNNYGKRRNCTVYLDTEPSEKGMAAINTIIHEPEWNSAGPWKFVIKEQIYTA